MNNPLSRHELNRVKGTGTKFNRFMGAMRFKGGIKNAAGVRLFLLWLDLGEDYTKLKIELNSPKGDESRHDQPKRRYDIAGIDYPEGEATAKVVDRDEVLKELEEIRAEEAAIKAEYNAKFEKKEARRIRKKRERKEARRNGN